MTKESHPKQQVPAELQSLRQGMKDVADVARDGLGMTAAEATAQGKQNALRATGEIMRTAAKIALENADQAKAQQSS